MRIPSSTIYRPSDGTLENNTMRRGQRNTLAVYRTPGSFYNGNIYLVALNSSFRFFRAEEYPSWDDASIC